MVLLDGDRLVIHGKDRKSKYSNWSGQHLDRRLNFMSTWVRLDDRCIWLSFLNPASLLAPPRLVTVTMLLYSDLLNNDELFSDAYPMYAVPAAVLPKYLQLTLNSGSSSTTLSTRSTARQSPSSRAQTSTSVSCLSLTPRLF